MEYNALKKVNKKTRPGLAGKVSGASWGRLPQANTFQWGAPPVKKLVLARMERQALEDRTVRSLGDWRGFGYRKRPTRETEADVEERLRWQEILLKIDPTRTVSKKKQELTSFASLPWNQKWISPPKISYDKPKWIDSWGKSDGKRKRGTTGWGKSSSGWGEWNAVGWGKSWSESNKKRRKVESGWKFRESGAETERSGWLGREEIVEKCKAAKKREEVVELVSFESRFKFDQEYDRYLLPWSSYAPERKREGSTKVSSEVAAKLVDVLVDSGIGPLIISRMNWGEDKRAVILALFPELNAVPGRVNQFKRFLFSSRRFWPLYTHRARGATYEQSDIWIFHEEERKLMVQEQKYADAYEKKWGMTKWSAEAKREMKRMIIPPEYESCGRFRSYNRGYGSCRKHGGCFWCNEMYPTDLELWNDVVSG